MAVAAFKVKGIKEISRAAAGIYLSAVILGGAMMVFEEQLRPGGSFSIGLTVLRYWGYRTSVRSAYAPWRHRHPFLGRSAGLEDLQRPCCKERPCAG